MIPVLETPRIRMRGHRIEDIQTEAVHTALHWADAHLAADKTVCIIDPDHRASIRVAEKSGCLKQGMADFAGAQTLVMERSKHPQNSL